MTQLDGTKWGGVTPRDIVISSYAGFMLDGHKAGYVMPMPDQATILDGNGTTGDVISQNGVKTPGLFAVPVCEGGMMQAWGNWKKYGGVESNPPSYRPPYYPCQPART